MWLGCIVTHRGVTGIFAIYTSLAGPKLAASIPCPEIWNMIENTYGKSLNAQLAWAGYSTCSGLALNETVVERYGLVYGDILSAKPEEKVASLHLAFGPAFWVAILIHVAATEIYLGRRSGKGVKGKDFAGGMKDSTRSANDKGVKIQ